MYNISPKSINLISSGWVMLIIAIIISINAINTKAGVTTPFQGALTNTAPIEANADDLNYDRKTGQIVGKGNVVITKGHVTLKADYVRVNVKTEDAKAYGNVKLYENDTLTAEGTSLDYNFGKKTGKASGFTGSSGTFRILKNESMEKTGDNTFLLHNAIVTTCTNTGPHTCHYRVKAKKAELIQDDYLKVKGAIFYLGKVPAMYLPYWRHNLDDDFGWEEEPGHSGRLGFYLKSAYRYRMNEVYKGRTHLDFYSERGVGVGQDLYWESHSFGTGGIEGYFINDDKPVPDNEDNSGTYGIEPERYRVKFDHFVSLSPKDSILVRGNYLSDKFILRDFFEDEYRLSPVPENDATYTHRENNYTFNILARSRVNDFFESVNRIPEVSLNFVRQQIAESSFYYESRTSAGYLEKTYAIDDTGIPQNEDYSSGRFDTVHRIFRPSRHFGFLNLVPRAGVRGTYYSETGHTEYTTNVVTIIQTNGLANLTTNTTGISISDGSGFREQFEIGMEASFKAFRVWDGNDGRSPLRHVAEPYIDYSYMSEPSLLPGELYQFDSIDTIRKNNKIKLGMRNKLQTKRSNGSANIIDIDLYTYLNFEPEGNNKALENFVMDTEMYPTEWMRLDFDSVYNTQNSTLHTFNSRIQMNPKGKFSGYAEYRHLNEVSDLLLASLTFKLTYNWHYNIYGRYEAEDSRFEEGGGYIQRNFDCMAFRLGTRYLPGYTRDDGIVEDDDLKIMFEFWLKAIPGLSNKKDNNRGYHGI